MKKYFLVFFVAGFSFICPAQVTVNISASADNTIYQMPNGNSNALGENLFSGTNGGGSARRCLIKFDIAAMIPAGAMITEAVLTLNCNTTRATADDISLHKLTGTWGEGTSDAGNLNDGAGVAATANDVTWLANFFSVSNWFTAGGDFVAAASATQSINSPGFYSWNSAGMLADVQGWLNAPAGNYGWIMRCNETSPSTARKFGSRENSTAANRPVLTITYTIVLPVMLEYFKATPVNNAVLLKWKTSSEINSRLFKIMHSTDAASFSQIAVQHTAGGLSSANNYDFLHENLISGYHYYKLVQVDLDGREKHSDIERLWLAAQTTSIRIWPNPAVNQIHMSGVSDFSKIRYSISNAAGLVKQKANLNNAEISVNNLPPGLYQVSFYNGEHLIGSKRLLKVQ